MSSRFEHHSNSVDKNETQLTDQQAPFSIINVNEDGDFYIYFPGDENNSESLSLNLTDVEYIDIPPPTGPVQELDFKDGITELLQNSLKLRMAISQRNQNNQKKLNLGSFLTRGEYFNPELLNFWPSKNNHETELAILVDSRETRDAGELSMLENLTPPKKTEVKNNKMENNFFTKVSLNHLPIDGKEELKFKNKLDTVDMITTGERLGKSQKQSNSTNSIPITDFFAHKEDKSSDFVFKPLSDNIEPPTIFSFSNEISTKYPITELENLTVPDLVSSDSLLELGVQSKFNGIKNVGINLPFQTETSGIPLPNDKLQKSIQISTSGIKTNNDIFDVTTDYSEYDTLYDEIDEDGNEIETFSMEDFDPLNFGIPRLNLSEFSNNDEDLSKNIKKGGLRMDNKTATFIFVLLSSISDAINFHGHTHDPLGSKTPNLVASQSFDSSQNFGIPLPNVVAPLPENNRFTTSKGSFQPIEMDEKGLPIPMEIIGTQPLSTGKSSLPSTAALTEEIPPFVRLFQEIPPPSTPICESIDPPDCPTVDEGYCLNDPNYPSLQIEQLLKRDISIITKYAEVTDQSANDLVPMLSQFQEDNFNYSYYNPNSYDKTHWFGPEGYLCPSSVSYGKPLRARNAKGEWKIVLNDGDIYTQTLRIETCLYADAPCRLVAPCFRSKCVQKYTYHRLVSFDPCHPSKGLYVDIYRLPSACSCYAPGFHGFNDFSFHGLT